MYRFPNTYQDRQLNPMGSTEDIWSNLVFGAVGSLVGERLAANKYKDKQYPRFIGAMLGWQAGKVFAERVWSKR